MRNRLDNFHPLPPPRYPRVSVSRFRHRHTDACQERPVHLLLKWPLPSCIKYLLPLLGKWAGSKSRAVDARQIMRLTEWSLQKHT